MTDRAVLLRALRRLVYTDRLLTVEDAWKVLDLCGVPRAALDERA